MAVTVKTTTGKKATGKKATGENNDGTIGEMLGATIKPCQCIAELQEAAGNRRARV
jgi:hypothetical protein